VGLESAPPSGARVGLELGDGSTHLVRDRSSLPPCCYFLACYGEATNYHHHGVVRLMFILGRKS
jgi:hypothetical protein